MGRAPCCEKVGLNKGRWTVEEDEKLAKYIMAHGEGSWRSLPKNAGLLRCGKSCRLRWINYLRADLRRGNITQEEEEIIIKLHSTHGNRWSLIAGHLPGRTDNEIKNYWHSHLSRRLHRFCHVGKDGETTTIVLDKTRTAGKRRGGKTSRCSMKKNLMVRTTKHDKDNGSDHGLSSTSLERNDLPSLSLDSREISSITLDDLDQDLFQSSDEKAPRQDEQLPSATRAVDSEPRVAGLAMNDVGGSSGDKEHVEKGSCAEKNKMLDWELEGMEAKLREDEGDMWQWLWDIEDNKELMEVQAMEEHQMEYMASWLLSDVL